MQKLSIYLRESSRIIDTNYFQWLDFIVVLMFCREVLNFVFNKLFVVLSDTSCFATRSSHVIEGGNVFIVWITSCFFFHFVFSTKFKVYFSYYLSNKDIFACLMTSNATHLIFKKVLFCVCKEIWQGSRRFSLSPFTFRSKLTRRKHAHARPRLANGAYASEKIKIIM